MESRFLIVSALRENMRALRSIVGSSLAGCVTEALSGAHARRLMGEQEFANVVIDTPLSDEPGGELALYAESHCRGGVILFAKREIAQELEKRSASRGVVIIPKPVERESLRVALRALEIMRAKLSQADEENRRLRARLADEKLVSRAKCLLIERDGMTEAEAHRYIEKKAMDSRSSKREVAEDVIAEREPPE